MFNDSESICFVHQQVGLWSSSFEEGWLNEWVLMLHGTVDAPYEHLPVKDPHSKLAIVKKAHQERRKKKM